MTAALVFALGLWGSVEAAGALNARRCQETGQTIVGGLLAAGLIGSAIAVAVLG